MLARSFLKQNTQFNMIIAGREKRVQTKLWPISDFFMIMFLFRSALLVLSLSISQYGYCYDCCDCLLRGHHNWCGCCCCCCLRIHLVVVLFSCSRLFFIVIIIIFRHQYYSISKVIKTSKHHHRIARSLERFIEWFNVANKNEMRNTKKGPRWKKKTKQRWWKNGYKT